VKKQNRTLKQASELVRSIRHPLLICHVSPDGDAVGSLMGLGLALRQMGLVPTMACSDPVPNRFNYVPGVDAVVREVSDAFDLVISIDSSDLKRLGHFPQMPAFDSVPLLNIDHHLTNLYFGDVNLVDPRASSAAEVVFDADVATCLLTGIVTDTRGFRTSNVTIQVMEAALQLMEAGASLPYITHHGFNRRPTAVILLWSAALGHLQIRDRVIWTSISQAMRREVGYAGNGDAGLASFLVSADDADVAAVFVEGEDGRIEVGLRAVPGFDVAQVALQFGGGGHALAAGCTLSGPMEDAQAQTLAALQADLARQRRAQDPKHTDGP
jgi:phosphoesterase RecJ-like protein